MINPSRVFGAVIVLCVALGASPAWATLGGDASSVQSDQVQMKASRRAQAISGYTVHEMTAPDGTVVREYVSAGNKVFAVAWKGPLLPNLQQILGDYFPRLTAAASANHRNHRLVAVQADDVTIVSGGRLRSFAGHAYVTALMPAGVSPEDLQ